MATCIQKGKPSIHLKKHSERALEKLETMHEKEPSIMATHKGRVNYYAFVKTKACDHIGRQ